MALPVFCYNHFIKLLNQPIPNISYKISQNFLKYNLKNKNKKNKKMIKFEILVLIVIILALHSIRTEKSGRYQYAKALFRNDKRFERILEAVKPDPQARKYGGKKNLKVGIVGAGITGLYAALILDDLGIEFELLESNKDHIGGRLFTYHFNKDYKNAKDCAAFNDFAEMGAMRIPKKVTRVVGDGLK